MSLPFILDLAIGLIFIYLILSLLASEIQELITTVLQWRAVHLKKSIEILVAGDATKSEEETVIKLVNDLYEHPLIKSVNQEAKGFLTTLPRKFVWFLSSLPVKFSLSGEKRTKTIFGYKENQEGDPKYKKRSAPSYIPAATFATTLMETLGIPTLVQKLTESRLINFKDEQLHEIQKILLKLRDYASNAADEKLTNFSDNLYEEFTNKIEQGFGKIIEDFQKDQLNLSTSINRMALILNRYIEVYQLDMPENEFVNKALQQLIFLRKDIFDNAEQTISLKGLQPSINEVVKLINLSSDVHKEFENEFKDKESEAYKTFEFFIENLKEFSKKFPPSVVANMGMLAKRAQTRAKTTEEGIYILRKEIEETFDNSMVRASGVYKRNAKGVAILIGVGIAIIANADAFHIINRLSKDTGIRAAIVSNAGQIVQKNSSADLESVKNQTDQILTEIALPMGWNDVNLRQQFNWEPNTPRGSAIVNVLTAIPGWILSGIAISMGAPFWFELLGKVVNVRNTGKPPATSAKTQGDK
ncbi:hypothetical protein Cylst_0848 [Cylindrospermum stagnale PCC 7417]|uniref:Uncharacterized protein n=1 Tax=Cylindrospermum stagnale PCC 7417 TaxID=56107 RepID=K9WTP8_9NOST|nr:hypothetical protein [Cylindrospermum stagnale]AFZ23174.1 hypothetical protein Cylst_0848 [Cylindrospermum stagnale PCC 7417]